MAENNDGHWQTRESAAFKAAGLEESTKTHTCDSVSISMCAVIGTALGGRGDAVSNTMETANDALDFANQAIRRMDWIEHPTYKAFKFFSTVGIRWKNNLQQCQKECDLQNWQKDNK